MTEKTTVQKKHICAHTMEPILDGINPQNYPPVMTQKRGKKNEVGAESIRDSNEES
jgi:hypothetical protein